MQLHSQVFHIVGIICLDVFLTPPATQDFFFFLLICINCNYNWNFSVTYMGTHDV